MKVLICTYEAGITGGANRSLLTIIDYLLNNHKDVEIEVLVPRYRGRFIDELKKRHIICHKSLYFCVTSSIRKDGKDLLRIGKVYFGYALESVLGVILAAKFQNKKFDLVYTNTRGPYVGAKIAKILKIPHIDHVREFGAEHPLWGFWGYEKIYDNSDMIITISQALYNEYAKYIREDKLIMIPNGIDSPLNLEFHSHQGNEITNILLTGRLVPDKGHKDAILAMKELIKLGINNIHLYIAGSLQKSMHMEWYLNYLRELIQDNSLQEYVTFCGEIDDMPSLRRNMDIELITSIKETFGRVTVEGMRSGLLVIGSNTGGTVELIDDGNTGFLYQQGDPKDLAKKINYALNNGKRAEQIAYNGYIYAQSHFKSNENAEKVYNVMNKVVYRKSN